jgi:hypothetical protein
MARDKANRGEMSVKSSTKNSSTKKYRRDSEDEFGSKFGGVGSGDYGSNEPPEPEVLLSILHRKSKNT